MDGQFYFFDDPRFDSLDFGLELELGTRDLVSFTWGAEFEPYGVSLIESAMSTVHTSRSLDVSTSGRWKEILGRTLESVGVSWGWTEKIGKPGSRVYFPQDLLLGFAGNHSIVISALEISEGWRPLPAMDHITVFDDPNLLKEIWAFAEAEWLRWRTLP